MNIAKPLSQLISLTTANTVSNATLVFVSTTGAATITTAFANGLVKGSLSLPTNSYLFIDKLPTDTIAANVAVSATSVAYRG